MWKLHDARFCQVRIDMITALIGFTDSTWRRKIRASAKIQDYLIIKRRQAREQSK